MRPKFSMVSDSTDPNIETCTGHWEFVGGGGMSQEFLQAISPLKEHAKELVAQRAYSKVWNESYAAAMSVLDERLSNDDKFKLD